MGAVRGMSVWVRLVGTFAVCRDDRWLVATEVGSRKARLVLAMLAAERGLPVPVDRVVEALWGNAWPARPLENVATLVSRLRAALGADVVLGGRGGYLLGERVQVDLWASAGLVDEAEGRMAVGKMDMARAAAGQAMDLLANGVVLADQPVAEWAEPARSAQTGLIRRARHAFAEAALRDGDASAACRAAEAAVAGDPFDEVACRALMRAHESTGEPARALAAYQRLRVALADELGIDPAPATRRLHLAILRNNCPDR